MNEALAGELSRADDLQPDRLSDDLEALASRGAGRFDPARFAFIRGLLDRAGALREPRAVEVRRRARDVLNAFKSELEEEAAAARRIADELVAANSSLREVVETHLQRFDFRGLRQLSARQRRAIDATSSLLHTLRGDLEACLEAEPPSARPSISDCLQAQEKALLQSLASTTPERRELRSARQYRQSIQRASASRLLADSQALSPQDSGPLNPQKLATRALVTMEDLSPAAAGRLVTYLNTLFQLESLRTD